MTCLKFLQGVLLCATIAQPLQGLCSEGRVTSMDTSTPKDSNVEKAIDETSGPNAVLQRIGVQAHVESLEAYGDYNQHPGARGQFSTDGPTIQLGFDISNKHLVPLSLQDSIQIRASLTLMFNELVNVSNSQVQTPIFEDPKWSYFLREAKVILDIDPKTHLPIATIIGGIQDIESGAFHTAMPIPDNSPLRGVTRLRSAHAIQVVLNSKVLDYLAVAVFKTGVGHPENMGDNLQPSSPGMTVVMSKKLSESFQYNGAITQIRYPEQTELRINTGIAYENKAGGFIVYFDHVAMPQKGNPLYPEATAAWTLGIIKNLDPRNSITAEVSNVNNGTYRETAIGYKHILKDGRTSIAVGVRKTQDGPKFEVRAAYNYERKK